MGLLDSLKDRFSANIKFTRLSLMTQPHDIIALCQELDTGERARIIKAIESHFQWQSVAQVAQAMFPTYNYGGGVSAEALDMATSGQARGAMEMMRMENQAIGYPQVGTMPGQQAALSFAWMVLKGMQQREAVLVSPTPAKPVLSAAPSGTVKAFCESCGVRLEPGRYCRNCGARL